MLRKVRFLIHGSQFHDALSNSPLTILYQCIGNVKAGELTDFLKAEVSVSEHGQNAVPISFRVKNSFAAATGRHDVSDYLKATNVLVGWDLTSAAANCTPSTKPRPVFKASDRLAQLVAEASDRVAASQDGPQRQPPQRTLSLIIRASLGLVSKYPVAPLAGFFHGQRIQLADLARWAELDDATVYSELIGQLDTVPHGIVRNINIGDMGISDVLDGQVVALLGCLDAPRSGTGALEATSASAAR